MRRILDNPKNRDEIDRGGMCKIVERFPEQCEEAIKLSKSITIPKEVKYFDRLTVNYEMPKTVIVAGMGGSGISGNLIKDWLRNTLPIPIEVCRNHHLPAYVNENTLVLAVSYSGNTAETLSAYLEAIEKGCMTVAVTSGGLLEKFCEDVGTPSALIPSNYPPRSAIAHLFFPLVYSLEKLKLICVKNEIRETVKVVTNLRDEIKPDTPTPLNPSKRLAIGLKGSIPFICGFELYESVARRIKTQLNENSKTPAKTEFFPELNHNETVGWSGLKDLTKNFSVILIRDDRENIQIKTRIDLTKKLVFDKGSKNILEIRARGKGRLARMFSAMYVGDFASIYLSLLYRIDPTPTKIIDELKWLIEERINKSEKLREKFESLKSG